MRLVLLYKVVQQRSFMNKDKHIPQGYKDSSLGIIPKEWEVKRIGDIGKVVTGNTPPTNEPENYGSLYKFVGPVDITEKKYIGKTEKSLSKKGFSLSRYMPKGSILFTCIGSTIGKCAIANEDLTSNQQINAIICNTKNNFEYLYYELNYCSGRIKQIAAEQAVPIINKSTFENYKIICPPISEQNNIANVLSSWDIAIEKQSELIEKLTLRKRALMQKLLTGKKRLPGFSGKWQEKKLGGISIFLSNNTLSREQLNVSSGDVHCIHYGDVLIKYPSIIDCEKETMPFINENAYKESMIDFIENGDIIISDTAEDETVGKACEIQNVGNKKILAGLHTMLLRPNKGLFAPCFLGYYINSEAYHKKLIPLIQGIKVCSIGKKAIQNTTIAIPPLEEQKAIASVLVKADKEIELAKDKLASLQSQKRGVMQQLLTGKKRIK